MNEDSLPAVGGFNEAKSAVVVPGFEASGELHEEGGIVEPDVSARSIDWTVSASEADYAIPVGDVHVDALEFTRKEHAVVRYEVPCLLKLVHSLL